MCIHENHLIPRGNFVPVFINILEPFASLALHACFKDKVMGSAIRYLALFVFVVGGIESSIMHQHADTPTTPTAVCKANDTAVSMPHLRCSSLTCFLLPKDCCSLW